MKPKLVPKSLSCKKLFHLLIMHAWCVNIHEPNIAERLEFHWRTLKYPIKMCSYWTTHYQPLFYDVMLANEWQYSSISNRHKLIKASSAIVVKICLEVGEISTEWGLPNIIYPSIYECGKVVIRIKVNDLNTGLFRSNITNLVLIFWTAQHTAARRGGVNSITDCIQIT